MRLARVAGPDGFARLAALTPEEAVVDLALAARRRLERRGATPEAAARVAAAWFPGSLTEALGGGERWWEEAAEALAGAGTDATLDPAGLTWLPPVDPPVLRDCLVFGEHLRNAYGRLGLAVPEQFYEMPVYYKGNPASLIGHEQAAVWPGYADAVDYELELGFVVGRAGRNLTPEEALGHLAGVTIFDDFSARDVQAHEMGAMLGPSKCKDFCTAVGPCVTTVDELRLDGLPMVARINGEEWSRGSSADMIWSAAEILAWVSQCETVQAGDLIGSGTVGRGCGLELGRQLAPGDTVELEVGGIGVLRNRLGRPEPPGWRPTPRRPEPQQADAGT